MSEEVSIAQKFKIPVPNALMPEDAILIIQDQQDLRLILQHHLHKMNYRQVLQAADGYDAIKLLTEAKKPISFIVCDRDLQVLGGIDLLNEIRANVDLQRPPFLLTMAAPSKDKIMQALEAGVDEILAKPFTQGDVVPKIKNAFKLFHNPRNPERVYELAKLLLRKDEFEKAKMVYNELAQATPAVARPWTGLAKLAFRQKKMEEALTCLVEAEKRNASFVFIYEIRGEILGAMGDWDNALINWRKAIELSPLNPMRYEKAAEMMFQQKRYQDAATLLGAGISSGIKFPQLYHYLSQAHYALDDSKQAMKYIRMALSSQPENLTYLNQLGICCRKLEDYDGANDVYNKIIKLDPDNKVALFNKAVMLKQRGNPAEAIRLMAKIVAKFPDFAEAKNKLAALESEAKTSGAA